MIAEYLAKQLIPAIKKIKNPKARKNIASCLHAALSLDFEKDLIHTTLGSLQDAVFTDLLTNKDPALLNILIRHKMSPIMAEQCEETYYSEKEEEAALTLKRFIRSSARAQLHLSLFGQDAKTQRNLSLANVSEPRIQKIIYELTASHAIINRFVYHWTSLPNLKNIIRSRSFQGNKRLQSTGLLYQKNALTDLDIENGDGNVICFCPHLVDYMALFDSAMAPKGIIKLRNQLVRLTIDLEKVNVLGEYNQFFKLFDLISPNFHRIVTISNAFQVEFIKRRDNTHVSVIFTLNDKRYGTTINKAEAIFYGNLYSINQFCLLKIFSLIERARPYQHTGSLKKEFAQHLQTLSDEEISKLLILFAQGMTIYAEYNFNTILPLSAGLITAIYFAGSATMASFDTLDREQYATALTGIALYDEILTPIKTVSPPLVKISTDKNHLVQYSEEILFLADYQLQPTSHDFTSVPAALFAHNKYFETRMGAKEFTKQVAQQIEAPCENKLNH